MTKTEQLEFMFRELSRSVQKSARQPDYEGLSSVSRRLSNEVMSAGDNLTDLLNLAQSVERRLKTVDFGEFNDLIGQILSELAMISVMDDDPDPELEIYE